jgi:hypothetical protein
MRRVRILTAAVLLSGLTVLGGAGQAMADDDPTAQTSDSGGVISGNAIPVNAHIPIAVCGDTIDIIGLLNPASNNTCKQD